jgi:hypothetical protein
VTDCDDVRIAQINRLYRYRTPVLVGSWRPSRELAIEDAIRAKQASREDEESSSFKWIVPGEIEETDA